jgi:arginase
MNPAVPSLGFAALALLAVPVLAASALSGNPAKLKISIVRNDSDGPKYMAEGGLVARLEKLGGEIRGLDVVVLTPEEQKEYGAWNRDALESLHIGRLVAKNSAGDGLVVGLLTNCTDLLGMLAGLQHLRPAGKPVDPDPGSLQREGLAGVKPRRVGLVYFDAHADFNTPETTLSGMLGGMDVAVAAGMCLTRLRLKTGLDPALPTRYIVFGGLRDVDPLERELLDRSDCEYLSVEDIRSAADAVDAQMERLASLVDVIYVHVDMDVLDPAEVSGHPLTAPEGPTSRELAAAIQKMFTHPKAAAIGIASIPFGERDKDGRSLEASYRLIEAAVRGTQSR